MRIDKLLSNAGYGSRKEIKTMIRKKRIICNGVLVKDSALKVNKDCEILIDNVAMNVLVDSHLMMNKPIGYISSTEGDADYSSVIELITTPHPEYNLAGRLDVDTTGLLILSTNGNLIHKIISPKKDVQKLYLADVVPFDKKLIERFYHGIELDGDFVAKPVTFFDIVEEKETVYHVRIGITEGKYHQVKRMFKAIGSEVLSLHRQFIGALELDNSLQPGEYRELTENEIHKLFCKDVG